MKYNSGVKRISKVPVRTKQQIPQQAKTGSVRNPQTKCAKSSY